MILSQQYRPLEPELLFRHKIFILPRKKKQDKSCFFMKFIDITTNQKRGLAVITVTGPCLVQGFF